MAKCRLYIDESGTHNYSTSVSVDRRYLAITGVMICEPDVIDGLTPRLRELKYVITKDYDENITLHRREIANRIGIYSALKNPIIERKWNKRVLDIVANVEYAVCTIVIDKKSHMERYTFPMNPYHYCLHILAEKYVQYLERYGHRGDVLAESRGKTEDDLLEGSFSNVCSAGTAYVSKEKFASVLTSKQLKFKPKVAVAGLELAELIVMASKLDVLQNNSQIQGINSLFTRQIVSRLQPKYYRNPLNNRVAGYGKKYVG